MHPYNGSNNIDSSYGNSSNDGAIEALRQHTLTNWWRLTMAVWLTIGPLTLWQLRSEISLLRDYFTWTSVHYGLRYNFLGSVGFFLCIGLVIILLVREIRHIFWGLSPIERQRLEKQLAQIQQQGSSHPLWSLVNRS